jgi:hypothetical protein
LSHLPQQGKLGPSREGGLLVTGAKTKAAKVSANDYLAAVPDSARRHDAEMLAAIMSRATGKKPVMWGDSIVGFDSYHYVYETGHEGDSCLIGFSPRKANLVIYIGPGLADFGPLLQKLGKHKTGKSCLYVNRMADIDLKVLEQLIGKAVAWMRQKYLGRSGSDAADASPLWLLSQIMTPSLIWTTNLGEVGPWRIFYSG